MKNYFQVWIAQKDKYMRDALFAIRNSHICFFFVCQINEHIFEPKFTGTSETYTSRFVFRNFQHSEIWLLYFFKNIGSPGMRQTSGLPIYQSLLTGNNLLTLPLLLYTTWLVWMFHEYVQFWIPSYFFLLRGKTQELFKLFSHLILERKKWINMKLCNGYACMSSFMNTGS